MKLNRLTDEENQLLALVVEEYYAVLPAALKVHSLFATQILSTTLHRFGLRTRVLPCRLWCSALPERRDVVGGFINYADREKWNGHVVCLVGDWLVDAALYHLNPAFNYEVPKIIATRVLLPEPGTYARYRLNRQTEFVWYRLPTAVPTIPATGYEDFIDRFVDDLVAHIRRLLGYVDEVPEEAVPEADAVVGEMADETALLVDAEVDGAEASAESADTSPDLRAGEAAESSADTVGEPVDVQAPLAEGDSEVSEEVSAEVPADADGAVADASAAEEAVTTETISA